MSLHDSGAADQPVIGHRSTVSVLIERLEKATGPDRELDVEIGTLIGEADHSGPAFHRPFREWAKYYTASIDAALLLVPERHTWVLGCGRVVQYMSQVTPMRPAHHGASVGEADSTPAIALCIAALKAREAMA